MPDCNQVNKNKADDPYVPEAIPNTEDSFSTYCVQKWNKTNTQGMPLVMGDVRVRLAPGALRPRQGEVSRPSTLHPTIDASPQLWASTRGAFLGEP